MQTLPIKNPYNFEVLLPSSKSTFWRQVTAVERNLSILKHNEIQSRFHHYCSFYIIATLFLLCHFEGNTQSVEILGQLKLSPTFINENNAAPYALVLDTNDAIAFKSVSNIGVPSTGILLSEEENNSFLLNAGFTKKGRFLMPFEQDASLLGPGTFTMMSNVNTPPPNNYYYIAVWTGTEMIVWDSDNRMGGRYNPTTDTWASMSTVFSPSPRPVTSAIWTGTEMIVWGGTDLSGPSENTGARYNPNTDTWTTMTTINAPRRSYHSIIWTGTDMIIWGGADNVGPYNIVNFGSKYNPITNSWTEISSINAPGATLYHSAIWTGSDMIIHGGLNNNSTKKYDPTSNIWTTLTHNGGIRFLHTAVWTGSKMIIWGGTNTGTTPLIGLNTGAVYNVATDTWSTTTLTNAPSQRVLNTAVWTGNEMIIWGGQSNDIALNTGARYNLSSNSWIATTMVNVPSPRIVNSIWTGTEQIIWGGGDNVNTFNDGAKYNPISSGYLPPVNINMYLYSKN